MHEGSGTKPPPGMGRVGDDVDSHVLNACAGGGLAQGSSPGLLSQAAPPSQPPGLSPSGSAGVPGAAPVASIQPPGLGGLEMERPVTSLRDELFPWRTGAGAELRPPGEPPGRGRPRPGSVFDPSASGPGISQSGTENFLDGRLDPRTGWPFVFLDHFRPRPDRLESFWIVQTRDCPQEMGSDPWPCLKVLHFDERGELKPRPPSELLAEVAVRPVLIQVQGSLTTPDVALGGMLWTHTWLDRNQALPRGRGHHRLRLAEPAGLSQRRPRHQREGAAGVRRGVPPRAVLPGVPAASSRVCLLGQSYGGRVVPSALHLLGGGLAEQPGPRSPGRPARPPARSAPARGRSSPVPATRTGSTRASGSTTH